MNLCIGVSCFTILPLREEVIGIELVQRGDKIKVRLGTHLSLFTHFEYHKKLG